MTRIATLWAAVVTGVLSSLVVPAVAWANETEELRRGPRGFGFFGAGLLCCLIVVGGIVALVVVLTRRRR